MNTLTKEVLPEIIAGLPVGMLFMDRSCNCLYVNRAFEQLVGLDAAQCQGSNWLQYLAVADKNKVKDIAAGKSLEVSFLHPAAAKHLRLTATEGNDGLFCLTAENLSPTVGEDPEPQQVLMQKVIDCTDAILYSVNKKGDITTFNRAASQAVRARKGVLIQTGDYWPDIVSGESGLDRERMVTLLQYVLAGNSYQTIETLLRDNGDTVTYSVQASPIFDGQKEVTGTVLCAQDITLETRLQKEAVEKALVRTQELERWNQFYDTLLAVLAHDLRQPLSAIIMGADLVSYTKKTLSAEELKGIMSNLRNTCKKGIELLQGLLYWVKSKKEDFAYKAEPFDLCQLINEANALFILDQQEKEIIFTNEIPEGLIPFAHYQMTLFICRNLISNATKHAPAKSAIKIKSAVDNNRVTIQVQDSGKGMSEAQLKNLFSIHESEAGITAVKGAGMALTIAYDMSRQMSGSIEVESQPGKGTVFYLTLPLYPLN